MVIVFPMAGLSSRFTKEGYKKPKYMLDLKGHSIFSHAINSFSKYFDKHEFLFIYRDIQDTKGFIHSECTVAGIKSFTCIELDQTTEGQAHTVYLGLKQAKITNDESILIFNIDTFRPNYSLPQELNFKTLDGYLEVFEAEGEQWSFVLPKNKANNIVVKTTEKDRISSLCSSGLYYFKKTDDFKRVFEKMMIENDRSKNEFYIAPMYNQLIEEGRDIRYSKIELDDIVFCGTPTEYEACLGDEVYFR